MARKSQANDPYAPPPMYHDKSGRIVRIGLLAVLIAALGIGYFVWSESSPQQTAAFTPPAQQQQLADNGGYRAVPEQIPQAQPVAPTPSASSTARTPERRHSAPARSRAESSTPAIAPSPTPPAPLPPAVSAPQSPDTTPPAQG